MTPHRLAAALMLLPLAAGPALAAVTPPPKAPTPQTYELPQLVAEEDRSCLEITVAPAQGGSEILLRNGCALRVNWALCVRRQDEPPTLAHGSLSPAAVAAETVAQASREKTFTHRASFCSGITCKVVDPEC